MSKTVNNDSSVIPIIPLYIKPSKKVYCNFIFHNDKYNVDGGTRDEYRIYSNNALECDKLLFQENDILIFRAEKISSASVMDSSTSPEAAVEESYVYYLFRCFDQSSELYNLCTKMLEESKIRGNGHAVYDGTIFEIEKEINECSNQSIEKMDSIIDEKVTAKAQVGDINSMANLFNSVSFRDFVLTGYENRCAITGNVIRYGSFMNLEAAHICPRSHQGVYLPSNGIALCRDMHWAFDKGMFTIDDNFRVIVHPDIESSYLKQYDQKQLFIPENEFFRPDLNNLRYHRSRIYGLFKTSGSLVKAVGYHGNIDLNTKVAAEDVEEYDA